MRFPEFLSGFLRSFIAKEYRQTAPKAYRVIYRVTGDQVTVYLIADERRDLQIVLARRLLGA